MEVWERMPERQGLIRRRSICSQVRNAAAQLRDLQSEGAQRRRVRADRLVRLSLGHPLKEREVTSWTHSPR
jgi:hypothetical protein